MTEAKPTVARHLLLRLEPRVHLAVAAESLAKQHPRLGGPGTQHTITIEEPPAHPPGGQQLPLT
jgi:hypothetical protein